MRLAIAMSSALTLLLAAAPSHSGTATVQHNITKVAVDTRPSRNQIEIYVEEEIVNPEGCSEQRPHAQRYVFPLTNDIEEAMLSVLLTAKVADLPVKFVVEGCFDGLGGNNFPKIQSATMDP